MATKEDRYPKEYKPFPNDKPISSSQGNNNSSSASSGSSSGKQQQHSDFRDHLKSTISRHMRGFRATNVITYKRFRDKSTWQRPGEFAELVATDDEDAFTADPKEAWPIMQDMNIDIPIKELTKQHRVVDRNWTVPVSNKKFKQPEPIYPQSTGVKLRNVEDIMNDYSKKPQASAATAPSLSLSTATIASKPLASNANSIPRVADKSQRPLQLIPDKIKGVLQNLTDTRRKPVATTPSKPHGNTPSSNTPRKSSTLKSSTISPREPKIKKQSTPISKPSYPQTRPRVSSKTIPMEKVTQIENIPDLMEARKYLVGPDEVEFRSLSSLQEMPKDMHVKERPQLFIRLHPKPNESDMPKAPKQHIASASVNNIKIKQEKAALSSNKKDQFKTSAHSKSTTPSLPSDPSTKSVSKTTNSKKQSQSDQSQAPIRTSKSKKSTTVKAEGATTHTTIKSEKQAYASSVSAEFLRSTKIPKRSNSVNKSSHDMELEDGETISPSPSPIRTKSRSSHTDVDEESSNVERPVVGKASTAAAAAAATTTTTAAAVIAPPPTTTTVTTTSATKRREEDRSTRDRERDRDRYRDESSSSSRRDRRDRHRSRSRSRSPVSKSNRPESKSRRLSPPPKRQTSSESSHRRRSPPPARSERAEKTEKADKESTVNYLSSITRSDSSSRAEKENNTTTTSRADRERETSNKRKSLHDASDSSKTSTSSEPPTKRPSTIKTSKDFNTNNTTTNTPTPIEKDTKYTNNSTNPVSNSSSSSSKPVKKPTAVNIASTPKSVSTPNTATSTSSSTSTSTTLSAVNVPDKEVSATAPNAETPEQYKVFTIMFKQLALAHKRRGDTQKDPVIGIIDHFHALCDYMLNFYYVDKGNTHIPFKQASVAWKSLFPFSDSLLSKLQANHLNEMYGLCVRLVALIRYYIYSRMESATRPLLTKHLSGNSSGGTQDSTYTDRICIEMTEGLLREHEKAEKCYRESEKYMTFGKVATQFPGTFKDVCIDGNLLAGITLGGEAGVSVGPMFPFTPYSPLHHAAIAAKCILNEYVTKNHLNFSPITQPEEFM